MLHIFKKFEQFLTEERINEIAAKTGFKLRNYGIDARTFLKVILNPQINIAHSSLSKILLDFESYGIFVTRQSIHERFNAQCTDFLIEIHNELIKLTLNNKNVIKFNKIPKNISSVLVADSTSIGLHDIHEDFFKGISSKLKSRLKLLLSINILNLSVDTVQIDEGKVSDQTMNQYLQAMDEYTLILKDLGFTSYENQELINGKKAKYISRTKLNCDFYEPSEPRFTSSGKQIENSCYKKVDIPTLYGNLKENEVIDTFYYVKSGKKFYLRRVVITKVPEGKFDNRKKYADSKSRTTEEKELSPKTKSMMEFTIFVTNFTSEEVPGEDIYDIYARRWDIETIFKKLKSIYGIDEVKRKVNINRVLIQIYSKLILFALECLYIQDLAKSIPDLDISPLKIGGFFKNIFKDILFAKEEIKRPIRFLIRNLKKEIKKSSNKSS